MFEKKKQVRVFGAHYYEEHTCEQQYFESINVVNALVELLIILCAADMDTA